MMWLLVPGGVILLCGIGVLLIPKTTSTTQVIRFEAEIDDVWKVYTTPEEQKHWRADVGEIVMSEDGQSWSETLEASGMTINFRIVEKSRPETFILETGSPGSFEGSYVAKFSQDGDTTIGTFTETATTIGVLPRIMRFLFFNQKKFIHAYADAVKLELHRRNKI
ncbi:MAG: hypothetical protein AAF220_04875 [Pseudomonadota bacterium]